MNLQAKLTLGAVLLETVIVGAISAVDLGNAMQIEFEAARKPADVVRQVAGVEGGGGIGQSGHLLGLRIEGVQLPKLGGLAFGPTVQWAAAHDQHALPSRIL